MAPPTTPTETVEPSSSSTNTPTATPSPIPPPVPVETHPNRLRPSHPKSPDPSRLAPEDALTPPRLRPVTLDGNISSTSAAAREATAALRPSDGHTLRANIAAGLRSSVAALRQPPAIPPVAARLEQERRAAKALRRKTRHQPQPWKKLLWIKHKGYPDNYTDPATFFEHLQWNPTLRPYEFWPLVADSMVIVQHVCSIAVFVSAYAGIYQDRLNPVAVVVCGTIATVVGWFMWDRWKREEEAEEAQNEPLPVDDKASTDSSEPPRPATAHGYMNGGGNGHAKKGLGLSLSTSNLAAKNAEMHSHAHHGPSLSRTSFQSISPIDLPSAGIDAEFDDASSNLLSRIMSNRSLPSTKYIPQSPTTLPASVSPRNQARIKTFKSALLIYFALLGLSPILKSLTKSTSSDSIWALATWLLIINIFFFDYGSQYLPSKISKPPTPEPQASMNGTLKSQASQASISTTASLHHFKRPALSTVNSSAPVEPPSANAATLPPQNTYPSSLSTNAAVMASTVLASRLPTTTSVFSLTLFSIQIFGLFPLFRRHLRSRSFPMHTMLTFALVTMASAGLGLILSQSYTHTYGNCGYCLSWCFHIVVRSFVGITIGGLSIAFVMGGCAWWLITLQRYKIVVIGPWDPARPRLAGGGRLTD